jgi:hypothetical protein
MDIMLCYCCYKDKDINEFGVHKRSKSLKHFCKECYNTYSQKERKKRQIDYIFDLMVNITNNN